MITLGNPYGIVWLVPVLGLTLFWIRTPIFVTAAGKRVLLWLKLAVCGLLVLALLDPRWETQKFQEDHRAVFLFDVSPSVDFDSLAGALKTVASLTSDLPSHVKPTYLFFSGPCGTIDRLPAGWAESPPEREAVDLALARLPREASTDLGGALEEGMKAIPPDRRGRLYLFTDGGDTHGGVGAATRHLAEANLPVDVIPLSSVPRPPYPRIVRAAFPDRVFPGEAFSAHILIDNPPGGSLTLDLRGSDGTSIRRILPAGTPGLAAHTVEMKPQARGVVGYVVQVTGSSPPSPPARQYATVTVRSMPKALVFEEDPKAGRFLRDLLAAEQIDFSTASPGSWPADLRTALFPYSCVILNNIHRQHFSQDDLATLQQAVRNGTGLLMVGGPNSYGLGEWTETPIEEALPVRMPKRTVNQPLALILVLDCSGSMHGDSWDYLIAATKEILRLCRGQYVGIIMFNHLPTWVLPLQQIDDLDDIYRTLDQYYPGGGTVFSLPLAQALVALKDQPFAHKNVLMMSDGIPSDFHFVTPLLENFREYKVSVTTVAAGTEVNPETLQTIADGTGGEFYESPNFAELPEIFRKEFKRISAPPFIEESFQPLLLESSTLARGIARNEIPSLDGLVITQKKDKATVVLASPRGDPVLAWWRHGLGRTAAFTPDLLPVWTRSWARWNGLGKLLRQTIKELSEGAPERFTIETAQRGADLQVWVQPGASETSPLRILRLTDAASQSRHLTLTMGPDGRYEAVLRAATPGLWVAEVANEQGARVGTTLVAVNESRELAITRPNLPLLRQIAEQTGGELVEDPEQVSLHTMPAGVATVLFVPLWPWLVLLAMLLYLVDIYLRRANLFGLRGRSELKDGATEAPEEIYRQLAQKFQNLAEEHSLRGEEAEAKRFYLRAKAFFMKAQATREAHQMWERYKRFEGR
ncbi:MAG: hypothetical protein OZSIB_0629 [Candidatus Ozemobacter sibiricus]|uniref:VWFA domain-containing protein n=1 Tax=Candidatus Ozemobacter sibiricus TaxID=2268124 RepID=A0A367ZTL8_9BACT|nr:MAG: hypothetical protein OZSIB_0629 [Candidatus Ozemobacter sibiricus]